MTRTTPSHTNEVLRTEYEQYLKKAMQIGARFAETDEEDREYDADEFASLLCKRVELLGEMEHLRTIEDACPLVRTVSDGERAKLSAEDLLDRLLSGAMTREQVNAEKTRVVVPSGPRKLSDAELREFRAACAAVAQENGSEFESSGSSVTLRKSGMVFLLRHFAFPSGNGIMSSSRISVMSSYYKDKRADSGMFYDDGEWVELCSDPAMQREIDRVIALFR